MPRRKPHRMLRGASLWLATCAAALGITAARAQTQLSPDPHGYPRVRQLASGEIVVAGTAFRTSSISIFASGDQGASFARVGEITDPDFAQGLCCGTIFELPRAVGPLPAGTLLWAGSVGQKAPERRMTLKVYKSSDAGRSWTYLSTAVTAPNKGGLWEPEFWIAADGALVMAYSDETSPDSYSQHMMQIRTRDGTRWADPTGIISSTVRTDRPGMAVVSTLADGRRIMTFEICGPADRCATYYKTSPDGWDWGAATDMGTAVRLADGRYFAHAPTNRVMPDGSLLVIGQMLMNPDHSVADANGTVIFRSASGDPAGPWTTIAAPVPVPGANNTPCINYSSSLLPVSNGTRLLEIAGRLDGGPCHLYFGSGPSN